MMLQATPFCSEKFRQGQSKGINEEMVASIVLKILLVW